MHSSLSHSSIQFLSPNAFSFLSYNNQTQPPNLLLFVTNQTSSKNSSQFTLSSKTVTLAKKANLQFPIHKSDLINGNGSLLLEQISDLPIQEEEKLNLDKRNSKLHVQDLAARIKALPTSQKMEMVKKVGKFETISEFNDVFMALVIADEVELALKFYSSLKSYEFVQDNWSYSILIHCYCKKNEPMEAKPVLVKMMENGFQPNVATFTQLINSFCKRGRLQKAFEVFGVMGESKCEPTINTYNCLLKGLCYVGRIEEAYELLIKIKKSSRKPDIYTYTAVMDGFCKVGRSNEALELLSEAIEMGLTPSVVTYNTLFNGYFKEGRPLDGVGLLKQMKEKNCLPDNISYNTLLHGLLQWGKIRSGLRVYKEMIEIGFEVDERMINTLLRGLCRKSRKEKGLLKDAFEVFDKMSSRGCVIYPCAYELVIEAFCNGNEMDKAFVSLCDMVRVGYCPSTSTFNNVIRGLCVEGKIEAALGVLVSMYGEESIILSRVPFDFLISEMNHQGMVMGAGSVYGAALKRAVVPQRKPRESCAPRT